MALEATFADGGSGQGHVESLTTGEEFAADLLRARGVEECSGWSVDLQESDGARYELNGSDFVLDLIAETEVPPAFPVCKSFFLVSRDKASSSTRTNSALASPHDPDIINTFEMEGEEPLPAPSRPRQPIKSRSIDDITRLDQHASAREYARRRERSASHEDLLEDPAPPLSKTSALNDRYFEGATTRTDLVEPALPLATRSRLNERYTNGIGNLQHVPQERPMQGLSETSKLNKRYLSSKQEVKSWQPETKAWQQEVGLASSSALNDRYFSRQEVLRTMSADLNGHDHRTISSQATTDAIEFQEFDFTELNGDEEDAADFLADNEDARTAESSRYVKYEGKAPQGKGHPHSTRAHIDRSRATDEYSSVGPRSSALSDTSEAPSLASHVKNVRIPSHTSDLE